MATKPFTVAKRNGSTISTEPALLVQCDQMARLFDPCLAICNKENLPNSINNLPKNVNFGKCQINLQKSAKEFQKKYRSGEISKNLVTLIT